MKRLQEIVALISVLPVSFEKKFTYVFRLIAFVNNKKLLDYEINRLLKELIEQVDIVKKVTGVENPEGSKLTDIREKLSQLAGMTSSDN